MSLSDYPFLRRQLSREEREAVENAIEQLEEYLAQRLDRIRWYPDHQQASAVTRRTLCPTILTLRALLRSCL